MIEVLCNLHLKFDPCVYSTFRRLRLRLKKPSANDVGFCVIVLFTLQSIFNTFIDDILFSDGIEYRNGKQN